jgi:transposase-like protein
MRNPFRYFNSSPEVIRLTVMMYIRYPLSLRQVEDLLFERGSRYLSRDSAVLVKPFRSDVCRGD